MTDLPGQLGPAKGFELVAELEGVSEEFGRFAWSPSGRYIAGACWDSVVYVWNSVDGSIVAQLAIHSAGVTSVKWLGSDRDLLSSSDDGTIVRWDLASQNAVGVLHGDGSEITSIDWSPISNRVVASSTRGTIFSWPEKGRLTGQEYLMHGRHITCVAYRPNSPFAASTSDDGTVRVWPDDNLEAGIVIGSAEAKLTSLAWSPDGTTVATSDWDGAIRIWDFTTGTLANVLSEHSGIVDSVAFSPDGRLLVSRSESGRVIVQMVGTWAVVAEIQTQSTEHYSVPEISSNSKLIVVSSGRGSGHSSIWRMQGAIDPNFRATQSATAHARIIVLGRSGAGKSSLTRAIAGRPFEPLASTHGIEVSRIPMGTDGGEGREMHIWDLAGQSEYRLVHRIYTEESAAVLLVFDAKEPDSLDLEIPLWQRMVNKSDSCPQLLVSSKCDSLDEAETRVLLDKLGQSEWSEYFLTSARTGRGISAVTRALADRIDWGRVPVCTSPKSFASFRDLIFECRDQGNILMPEDSLWRLHCSRFEAAGGIRCTRAEFSVLISAARVQGLAWRLRFGNLVLMDPGLMDGYAGAIIRQARSEPSGLGLIDEQAVLDGSIEWGGLRRVADREIERLLLVATIELCVSKELAVRESGSLLFPLACSNDAPPLSERSRAIVSFDLTGRAEETFVRLIVRLAYSRTIDLERMYKSHAVFRGHQRELIEIELIDAAVGNKLVLGAAEASYDSLIFVINYLERHLALFQTRPTALNWEIVCQACEVVVSDQALIAKRLADAKSWIWCQACDSQIRLPLSIFNGTVPNRVSRDVVEADMVVEARKRAEAGDLVVGAKAILGDFDVFICYNSVDVVEIRKIAMALRARGIRPWLDVWELRPGLPWQSALQDCIGSISSAAIFVGRAGVGPWQSQEISAILREFVRRGSPAIPVALPDCPAKPELPLFLDSLRYVDMREDARSIDLLIWGITGRVPDWIRA